MSYWAGLFDGEGCVTIAKHNRRPHWVDSYAVTVVLNNTAAGLVEALVVEFGGTCRPSSRAKRKPQHKNSWRWQVWGQAAANFLCRILPHLRIKAIEARIALAAVADRTTKSPGRRGRTDEATALWEGYYLALHQAKATPVYRAH